MKPVDQTLFAPAVYDGVHFGNCVAACIASILEIAISEVPHSPYMHDENRLCWLESMGWVMSWDYEGSAEFERKGYCIITGVSPREQVRHDVSFPLNHAVVGLDGMMVFDPHPSREGLALDKNAMPIVNKIYWLKKKA